MPFIPEPGPALARLRPMLKREPPSGGECPGCGRHNRASARSCTNCGVSLVQVDSRPRRFVRWLFGRG